ncbi:glycosyltransferase family 4 protein [Lentibacillus sp. CBA3610]|uniref:glycosyltransferase family 4 protein n=1 Tax=Lentibacillus sp. CBA3610 TaxID=2518176 RepID=UPI001595A2AB|nr:glycosyltransferase family 4 protein [Lentibacillus sp. CBA3610]QKY71102.1 glycosyltransferase family 1 protein [Lentibacillus sp. CBA3610]
MRVLHLPYGSPMIELSHALESQGIQSTSCYFDEHPFEFKPDICLQLNTLSNQERRKKVKQFLKESMLQYDIFHFHFGETFFADKSDLKMLKRAGKKMIVHHHGSEIRLKSAAQTNNPYVRIKPEWTEAKINQNVNMLAKYSDHAIVQDYELESYIKNTYKHVHVIPHTIDANQYTPHYPSPKNTPPLVVHAPTSRHIKGTEFILNAVNELKHSGFSFQFQLIEGVSNAEAKNLLSRADIVIDQLLIGASGYISSEAMAHGKPVICYIRPDLVSKYPRELPIVNANPDTITAVLKDLLQSQEKWKELGVKGRQYIENHHHAPIVADRYINIYNSL